MSQDVHRRQAAPRDDARVRPAAGPALVFDRALLTMRRNRVAAGLDAHAFLLDRAAEDILDRLATVARTFGTALVLGADGGRLSTPLARRPGMACVVTADPATGVLARHGGLRVAADEEALPFADGSLDLVVSALALQHVNDLPGCLLQLRRALKPDGLLLAAVVGGATLNELRASMLAAEDEVLGGASPRVAPFADVRDLGALLQRAGFALPVADLDAVTVTYETPFALMRDLKAMGAANVLVERSRQPVSRRLLMRAADIYAERFAEPDGRVRATFEIIHLTGWCPHESQQKPLRPGSAQARLADALGAREQAAGEKAGG